MKITYSKVVQERLDDAQEALDTRNRYLITTLEAKVKSGVIPWREAREVFVMDDLRGAYLKALTEIMMTAVPEGFTIAREILGLGEIDE